ncbi:unnamed protein product [Discosporangium mesarthrocarpum]
MPVDSELHKAAHNGDLGKVKELIDKGEIDVNEPGAAERRPLHRAAGGNNVEIMNYLLEKGAPVGQADKSGRTALHWAAISGHKEATEILLAKESDLLAQTSSGSTPFSAACEGGRIEVVRLCIDKAQSLGKLEEMCNLKDAAEKTPFDLAAAGQHKAVCKLLKEMGDPNAQSAACTIS